MIPADARSALEAILSDRVRFDDPMSRHTSLRIGGAADAAASPRNIDEVESLLRLCHEHAIPHTVLGNGFNTLVCDGGIEGVVILTNTLRVLETGPEGSVHAEAGVSHASLVKFCVQNSLAGLEFGAGIPGTVGGWIAMNAGIGVREAKDVVREIEAVSADGSRRARLGRDSLEFSYRSLKGLESGAVIVSALLDVTPGDRTEIQQEVKRLLAARSDTQPLDVPSCGSVFKNPEGDHAGRLIESAGLKGAFEGGAQISPVHANFIANTGGACAADVLALIRRAQDCVETQSGIRLETEVRIMGRETG
jgi:UDP-N-acetylmuramate dehydrogenase